MMRLTEHARSVPRCCKLLATSLVVLEKRNESCSCALSAVLIDVESTWT